ncbi:MAG: hypothetical protein HKP10_02600, partial [Kiritimatiellales bacterium]|nr:hypothetical protein [Kiritimatiellales bacterium]
MKGAGSAERSGIASAVFFPYIALMTSESNRLSTPGVDRAVLQGVSVGRAMVADAPISAQALLCLDIFQLQNRNVLWIATDVREMEKLHESIVTLAGGDTPPDPHVHLFQPMEKDPAVFGEHLKLVHHLQQSHGKLNERTDFHDHGFIIITCPQAIEQEVPVAGKTQQAVRTLSVGEDHAPEQLTDWMSEAGYEFGVEVYLQGEAALRGGILDCWPPGTPRPVRIEFFGDTIDSIRYFDDQTQCSIEKTDSIQLPQMDFGFAGEETCSLLELLPDTALIINPELANTAAGAQIGNLKSTIKNLSTGFDFYHTNLMAVSFDTHPKEAELARRRFVDQRCAEAASDWTIHFFFETEGTRTRFEELYHGLDGFQSLKLHQGVIHESAIDHTRRILIVTESDFYAYHTNRSAHARSAKRFHKQQDRVSEVADIQPG